MVKVFTLNKNHKIELTEKELKELLDQVYWEGYRDNSSSYTYSTPSPSILTTKTYPYWYSTTTAGNSNISGTTATTDTLTIKSNDFNVSNDIISRNIKIPNGTTITIGEQE